MPYEIQNVGGARPYCVFKKGTSAKMGCHTTRGKATAQVRALYASEASLAEFNALVKEAYAAAAESEVVLAAIYEKALTTAGQEAAAKFRSTSIIAAGFVSPSEFEYVPSLSAEEREQIALAQQEAADRINEILLLPLGLAFLSATLLETLVFRAVEGFDDQVLTQLRAIVEGGMREGLTMSELAGAIQSAFEGSSATSAEMLARTQITALTNESSLQAARSLEDKAIYKRWLTVGDGRVRRAHSLAAGQTKPLHSPFEIGGSSLMYPGDPAGARSLTANCRCFLEYTRALPLTASGSIFPTMSDRFSEALGQFNEWGKRLTIAYQWDQAAAKLGTITADASSGVVWRAPTLVAQRSVTPDRRMIETGALDHRELPLPLMALFKTGPGGHEGADLAGRIDVIEQEEDNFRAEGVIDSGGAAGAELIRLREAGMPLGISVDLAIHEREMRAKDEPFGAALEADAALEAHLSGTGLLVITKATILGATIAPMQAIDEANEIEVLAVDTDGLPAVVRAHAAFDLGIVRDSVLTGRNVHLVEVFEHSKDDNAVIVAFAGHKRHSIGAFRRPEADHAHPMQYTDDGFLFGHLAPWDCCHVGWTVCTPPPPSSCDYAYFHSGAYKTAEGEMVAVGKLVFSMTGGKHAPESMSAQEAAEYYDDYTKCAGYVVAQDGEHGIWMSGIQKPGLTEEELEFLRLHPMSGDWRPIRGHGDSQLIGGFSVTIGGYPMPQTDMLLTASAGAPDRMRALIITPGWVEEDIPESDLARMARVLAARAHGAEALSELAHRE